MKMLVFACVLMLTLANMATPYVTNVVAKTRMPWNGLVDVSYEIVGDVSSECTAGMVPEVVVSAVINGEKHTAQNLGGDASWSEGCHSCWWNLTAEGVKCHANNVVFTVSCCSNYPLYCIIDLSTGAEAASYEVSYLNEVPTGGWSDEYKSTKLVMRRCPAGADPLGRYTLTKAFYAGVFEVTQKQWYLVMGSSTDTYKGAGDFYPVYYVSYNDIRGSSTGAQWPVSAAVDAASFIGKLRAKTGLSELDLPTEAQWEYACRAGTTTMYNLGDNESDLAAAGWYGAGLTATTHTVGEKKENDWGLYDMHGNVTEWCLDRRNTDLAGTDPIGSASGLDRIYRGGSCFSSADACASSYREGGDSPRSVDRARGFRLFRTLP